MSDMTYILKICIVTIVSVGVGVLAGNGGVYVFNHIPDEWLKIGNDDSMSRINGTQRIKSLPWKYVFTASFIVIGIYMGISNWQYAFAGFIACWLLLLIGASDKFCGVMPNQLLILLAATGFGFISFHGSYKVILEGIVVGAAAMMLILLVVKLVSKKKINIDNIKLCAILGMISGLRGIVWVMIIGFISCGVVTAVMMIKKKEKKIRPLGPYMSAAGALYIILLNNYI